MLQYKVWAETSLEKYSGLKPLRRKKVKHFLWEGLNRKKTKKFKS